MKEISGGVYPVGNPPRVILQTGIIREPSVPIAVSDVIKFLAAVYEETTRN